VPLFIVFTPDSGNSDTQDERLSGCEHLLSGRENERPDALFSQASCAGLSRAQNQYIPAGYHQ